LEEEDRIIRPEYSDEDEDELSSLEMTSSPTP